MVRRFCPKCGKEYLPGEKYYENFYCSKCYTHNQRDFALPSSITLNSCQFCNAFSVTVNGEISQWDLYRPKEEGLFDFIGDLIYRRVLKRIEKDQNICLGLDMEENDLDFQNCKDFMIKVPSGETEKLEGVCKDVRVFVKKIFCNTCAAKKGGQFDSVIQVRYMDEKDGAKLDAILDEIAEYDNFMHDNQPDNFVSKVESVTNGYDLKISTKQYAKHLVTWIKEKHPMHLTVSKKLMGVERMTGGDLYRIYFNLALLPVEKGNIIETGEEEYEIVSIRDNDVKMKRVGTDKINMVKLDWFSKKKYRIIQDKQGDR